MSLQAGLKYGRPIGSRINPRKKRGENNQDGQIEEAITHEENLDITIHKTIEEFQI